MSKKAKPAAHPKRERKKTEKPARKPARPRRAPTKTPPRAHLAPPPPVEKVVEKVPELVEHYIVAVRLDGTPNVKHPQKLTLDTLRMKTRFSAVVLADNSSVRGMLQKVKDHITWADAQKGDLRLLLLNRAKTSEGLGLTDKFVKEKTNLGGLNELLSALYAGKFTLARLWETGIKPVFHLHPPRGGFRWSSKRPVMDRGELGYRKQGLADLLAKMC